MKILVTGVSGTIGLAVAERLMAAGHEVVGYDVIGSARASGLTMIVGDVRDFARLRHAARGCDAGLHLAAVAGETDAFDMLAINALGAYGFLAAARDAGFKKTIIAGSAVVHLPASDRDNGLPAPSLAGDVYDLSKSLQEIIANDFHAHGLNVLGLRFGHVVHGKTETSLEGTSLQDEQYCRGGWVALEDIAQACLAGLTVDQIDDEFEVLNIVGAKGARDRFRVGTAEDRLGFALEYDFVAYEP